MLSMVGFRLEWLGPLPGPPSYSPSSGFCGSSLVLVVLGPVKRKKHVMTGSRVGTAFPSRGAILFLPWTGRVLGKSLSAVWQPWASTCWRSWSFGDLVHVWARIHLGRFWSNAITHKEGHRGHRHRPVRACAPSDLYGPYRGDAGDGYCVGTATAISGSGADLARDWQRPHGGRLHHG